MRRQRIVVFTAVAFGLLTLGYAAQARGHHHHEKITTRQVVFLTPGTGFDFGSPFESQLGEDHYQYWKKLRDQGKVAMVGYFNGTKGEMIIGAPGVGKAEMNRLANDDPAVKSLIATPEVSSWLLTLGPKKKKHDDLDGLE